MAGPVGSVLVAVVQLAVDADDVPGNLRAVAAAFTPGPA